MHLVARGGYEFKFFYISMKARRNHNAIKCIEDGDLMLSGKVDIELHITNFIKISIIKLIALEMIGTSVISFLSYVMKTLLRSASGLRQRRLRRLFFMLTLTSRQNLMGLMVCFLNTTGI